jgi:hypothetical protein
MTVSLHKDALNPIRKTPLYGTFFSFLFSFSLFFEIWRNSLLFIFSEYDGHQVIIPQGQPINRKEYADSSFFQSEYLVYKESQVRIRYLFKVRFKGWFF